MIWHHLAQCWTKLRSALSRWIARLWPCFRKTATCESAWRSANQQPSAARPFQSSRPTANRPYRSQMSGSAELFAPSWSRDLSPERVAVNAHGFIQKTRCDCDFAIRSRRSAGVQVWRPCLCCLHCSERQSRNRLGWPPAQGSSIGDAWPGQPCRITSRDGGDI